MNNVIKGWITTIVGLGIMVVDVLYFFGFIQLPKPSFVPTPVAVLIAFIVGIVLFLVPHSRIEKALEEIYITYLKKWL
jgi:membrane protein CcdC involved in cytochrome C biogenesis